MKKYKLWTYDIVFYKNDIFFSATQFNGLFKADLHDGRAQFIGSFPNEPKTKKRLHSAAIRYKNEILFLPDLSSYITLFNIEKRDFYCIDYPLNASKKNMLFIPLIAKAILIGTCVYAFGARHPCIIQFDFETHRLKVYDGWFEEFKKYGYKENTAFFRLDLCHVNNSLYASTFHNDLLVEFNLNTKEVLFHQMTNHIQGILHCEVSRLWLLEENELKIDIWNKSDNSLEIIDLESDLKKAQMNFHCFADMLNEIWLFPYLGKKVLIIDKKNGKIKTKNSFEITKDDRYQNDNLGAVWFSKVYNNKLYFMSVIENKLYCFTDGGNEEFCIDIFVDKTKIDKYLFQDEQMSLLLTQMQDEQRADFLWRFSYDLDDWLDILIYAKPDKGKREKREMNFGEIIYNLLK